MVFELVSFSLFAILIGFRHGMDSDHIAAIADMVGAEHQRNRQLRMGITYALGHGAVVVIIGLLAIFVGARLPSELLSMLEFLVGFSLLLLGGFILFTLFQQRNQYEYQSRWQIISGMLAKVLNKKGQDESNVSKLGIAGAFVIGVLHGVGAETPTQVLLLSSSLGLDNMVAASMQLVLFTVGLLIATILVTYLASWGFLKAQFKRKAYLVLGSITGLYSVGLGISIILGM